MGKVVAIYIPTVLCHHFPVTCRTRTAAFKPIGDRIDMHEFIIPIESVKHHPTVELYCLHVQPFPIRLMAMMMVSAETFLPTIFSTSSLICLA